MGLIDKLNDWMHLQRERLEQRNMKQATGYFGDLLKKGRVDTAAICQSIGDYRDYPKVTRKQTELLLKHRFFRYVGQIGYPGWQAVMDALKDTRYGMQAGTVIPYNVKTAAEDPLTRLLAQYKTLESEYKVRNSGEPLSTDAQAEKDAARRLLNYCMKESDLEALKELALKGKQPEDSVAIRYGLTDGYREIGELRREWSEEMRGDNHSAMALLELKIADEEGKLMRQAAAMYEKEMAGKLPDDYRRAMQEERGLLWELSRKEWNEDVNLNIPLEMMEKYGLARDLTEIADRRLDYMVSMDTGNDYDYPQAVIDRHVRAVREQAGKELKKLEARMFPEKAASRERKVAPIRAGNRESPSPSVRREQKVQPGKEEGRPIAQQKPDAPQMPKRARIKM